VAHPLADSFVLAVWIEAGNRRPSCLLRLLQRMMDQEYVAATHEVAKVIAGLAIFTQGGG
jgi:hypothetical protein